jgi:hypothetical protein
MATLCRDFVADSTQLQDSMLLIVDGASIHRAFVCEALL